MWLQLNQWYVRGCFQKVTVSTDSELRGCKIEHETIGEMFVEGICSMNIRNIVIV